jgi:hypothetical protein
MFLKINWKVELKQTIQINRYKRDQMVGVLKYKKEVDFLRSKICLFLNWLKYVSLSIKDFDYY